MYENRPAERRRLRSHRLPLACLALALGPLAVAAAALEDPKAEYERLLEWKAASTPLPLPPEGLAWRRDTASWALESGELWPLRPTSDGRVTGFYFEGRGRFRMTVPDPIEAANLARMAEAPGMKEVDIAFDRAVVRATGELMDRLPAGSDGLAYIRHKQLADRHERCLTKELRNLDARVVAGLLRPGDDFLRVEMATDGLGWLIYEFDGLRREEIRLAKLERNFFHEVWVSLERPEHRFEDGRPRGDRNPMIDLHHVELEVDLAGARTQQRVGRSGQIVVARIEAEIHLTPTVGGTRALPLSLSPVAEVHSVTDEKGRELAFLRDHVGGRVAALDKRIYEPSLLVLLERPLERGEGRRLRVAYEMEVVNYLPGRSWYPNLEDNLNNLHTARLAVKVREKQEVRAIGRRVEETVEDGVRTSVWVVEKPTKMCGLTYGSKFKEEVIEVEDAPTVVTFGPQVSRGFGGNMIRNVGADVTNSLQFFQWLFDDRLPGETLQITGIAAGHGQAFEGFLHVAEATYASESPGASELFRAHETAHQWWGHRIGWHSYRDQWLSESLAEYSALMYLESVVKGGEREFREALQMYTNLLLGSQKGAFSKYARPFLNDADLSHRRRMGPIGLGYRASNALMPQGYTIQAYYKGPLVLHMLRRTLGAITRGDEAFLSILRDFVREQKDKNASTEDFLEVINRHAPGDWSFFVDQWIYGTDIPTYTWSYEVPRKANAEGSYVVELEVEQRDVDPGFAMPVPVAIEFSDGRRGTYIAQVKQTENRFRIPLPARPSKLVFAPDFAVLAKIKKR